MVEEVRMGPKEDKSQTNEPNIGRDRGIERMGGLWFRQAQRGHRIISWNGGSGRIKHNVDFGSYNCRYTIREGL